MAKQLLLAYFAGVTGNSMGLFYFGDGIIAGADIGGMKYDGKITQLADGSYEGSVHFAVSEGMQLITGMIADRQQTVTTPIKLVGGFDDGQTVTTIETPAGPINARFERIRELP